AAEELLSAVQASLLQAARDEQERRTLRDPGYGEMIAFLRDAAGFVAAPWCGRAECEARVKEDSSATIRCLPLDGAAPAGSCACCGRSAAATAVWAQAY